MSFFKILDTGEVLSKSEMKKIQGGVWPVCTFTFYQTDLCGYSPPYSSSCENHTAAECQDAADPSCDQNDCCEDVDCR